MIGIAWLVNGNCALHPEVNRLDFVTYYHRITPRVERINYAQAKYLSLSELYYCKDTKDSKP